MSSREEKLAAARKKLKEFQGKNREPEFKSADYTANRNFKNASELSNESSPSLTPIFGEKVVGDDSASLKSGNSTLSDSPLHRKDSFTQGIIQLNPFANSFCNEESSSVALINKIHQEQNTGHSDISNPVKNSDFKNDLRFHQNAYYSDNNYSKSLQNSLLSDEMRNMYISENGQTSASGGTFHQEQYRNGHFNLNDFNNYSSIENSSLNNKNNPPLQISSFPAPNDISLSQRNRCDFDSNFLLANDPKQFFDNGSSSRNSDAVLNDVLQPLQAQLQNHVQTISILVGERNDLQTALSNAQSLVNIKTGELDEVNKKYQLSNDKIHELESKLREYDTIIKNFLSEKEQLMKINESYKSDYEKLKSCFELKEEEESELKQRLEAKNKECENLLLNFRETQNQLNMCQIKIQQLNTEDAASSGSQIIELQFENKNLKQKIFELEKLLEITNTEKEQSSQNFHVYAQQCNSQITALTTQIKELTLDNENRLQENKSLLKSIEDLKTRLNQQDPSTEKFEVEIADLHSQISSLTEVNSQLQNDIQKKEEERLLLEHQLEEKVSELNDVEACIKELKSENTRLLSEMESSNANERLLAAMESDKVAAARAVSQNQKLKEQIIELEGGFVKLSHEKLELTDQLAHERHVNKKLQARLDSMHHHHDSDDRCHHDDEKEHPVNDSNEIEELRNIIRQLQDDKTELLSRLNHFTSTNSPYQTKDNVHSPHETESVHEDLEKCENSKLLLQQMEEKVKKTMNEIATLDEEKQKLEHLVLQLQGETETIGEYISLYQKQRMLLRQRTKEKDEQLIQLSRDKEELRSKLSALDELVQSLLADKIKSEAGNASNVTNISPNVTSGVHSEAEGDTAGKIRALITEIGSTNLVNSHSVAFEHCPCCSGRLITI